MPIEGELGVNGAGGEPDAATRSMNVDSKATTMDANKELSLKVERYNGNMGHPQRDDDGKPYLKIDWDVRHLGYFIPQFLIMLKRCNPKTRRWMLEVKKKNCGCYETRTSLYKIILE